LKTYLVAGLSITTRFSIKTGAKDKITKIKVVNAASRLTQFLTT